MENVIEISRLRKTFKNVVAVNDLSFKVKRGELFAFLGVNGAGKSTTISIMCGSLEKDGGKVIVGGCDIDENLTEAIAKIGVVFQNSVLDSALTVKDNLRSRAALYGICGKAADDKIAGLASLLDFNDLLGRTVGKLSGGQRRRIDVARALINDPEILILDEPTTGLDPQTRKTLWSVVDSLRKQRKMTVFLTTHYMEEATEADYVIILDGGKIAAEGTPIALKNQYADDYVTVYNADEDKIRALNKPCEFINGAAKITVKNTEEAKKLIMNNPDAFVDFEITKGKMDDVFLTVTGKKLTGVN